MKNKKDYIKFREVTHIKRNNFLLWLQFVNVRIVSTFRRANYHYCNKHKIRSLIFKIKLNHISNKYQVTLSPECKIGDGLVIFHNGPLVISKSAIIGEDCTIGPNVLIGMDYNKKRFGSPIIGNNVYIGNNSTIVGNIKIGNNVFIAPNTFINFDVPDNCMVLGSPGIIHVRH